MLNSNALPPRPEGWGSQLALAIALECIYRRHAGWAKGSRREWAHVHGLVSTAAIAPAVYAKHPITRRDVGHFERLADCRIWLGNCTCGSGLVGSTAQDEWGAFLCISCSACKRGGRPRLAAAPQIEAP